MRCAAGFAPSSVRGTDISTVFTQGPMLNQVLNPWTKAHANSPFKVHYCKTTMKYSRCWRQSHTLGLMFRIRKWRFLFCHLQKQLYLMHKRENQQVTFGGEQMPKFWFVLEHRYEYLWQPVSMTVPPPGRMRSRAGVWQGVQHHIALIHVALQG